MESEGEDKLICLLENEPFSHKPTPPTVYIQSDGGHGGMAKINFCPFCGKKIEIGPETDVVKQIKSLGELE